jgi:hypothetical protein
MRTPLRDSAFAYMGWQKTIKWRRVKARLRLEILFQATSEVSGDSTTYCFRSRTSRRFHPKRRASTDHEPGPSSARAAPSAQTRNDIHESEGDQKMLHSARIAASAPAIGVHRPTSSNKPNPIARRDRSVTQVDARDNDGATPTWISVAPVARRSSSRPAPGQPRANVENKRRNDAPVWIGVG